MTETNLTQFTPEKHNRVRRLPERGVYDRDEIHAIIDEALICHLSFVQDGQPFVIPSNHARDGDDILLHGSRSSRLMQHIASGAPLCAAFTLVDGLVLARSVLHSDMNYRSVVVFGQGEEVVEETEKIKALRVITEHLAEGRWADARQPTHKEILATAVVRIHIASASAKVHNSPPADDEADYELPIWAGVVPFRITPGAVEPDPRLNPDIPMPVYVKHYTRKGWK